MTAFPWIKSYPAGVRWDAELQTTPVPQLLDDTAAKWPDKPALDFMGKKTTYRELQALVNHAARGFQQLGQFARPQQVAQPDAVERSALSA